MSSSPLRARAARFGVVDPRLWRRRRPPGDTGHAAGRGRGGWGDGEVIGDHAAATQRAAGSTLLTMAAPADVSVDGLWIRESDALPWPGLVVDYSAIAPFSLAGLGLMHVRRWRTLTTPVPVLSHLALDLSDPRAVTINYRVHADDAEVPLAVGHFASEHPAAWSAALASGQRVAVTVARCAPLLTARTPAAAARALDDAWTGIIACDSGCVGRESTPTGLGCDRHSQLPGAH